MNRQQSFYVQTVSTVAGNQVLKTDFPIGTIVINNTTDAKFKIYFGELSLGIGTNLFDYVVDGYTFARLPIHSRTSKITIEWTGTTKQFEVIRFDLLEEKMDMHIQANPPMTGGVGLAQNVTVANALPAGTATIGKVNIGTSDIDISKNGASIAGETLSAGGSDSLGWLSEIAKRIKTVLTVSINAGTNTIGKVDLNAGANIIGKVDINTIPNVTLNTLPSGANKIGTIDVNDTTKNSHETGELTIGTTEVVYDMTGKEISKLSYIINDGASDVFLSFDSTVATTTVATTGATNSVIRLKSGQGINDLNRKITKIRLISGSAGNVVRFLGV